MAKLPGYMKIIHEASDETGWHYILKVNKWHLGYWLNYIRITVKKWARNL